MGCYNCGGEGHFARERGATTMCSAANVEQGGVEKLATSEKEVAGEKLLIKKERHALESE